MRRSRLLATGRATFPLDQLATTGSALGVLQAEHLCLIVISEDFRVATPIHHGIERFLGGGIAQRVLELLLEAYPGRAVTGALVEHVSDVLRQRYRGKEVPGEDHLARLRIEIGKIARRRAQQNVALPDLGKAEVV